MSEVITSWQKFDQKIRLRGCSLLEKLDTFPDSILVTGCQRSGTTIVSRVITQSAGMVDFQFGHDDELDAALILSGHIDHTPRGRYCFQTTYLNNCYDEYLDHDDYRMVWVLRNPHSVVYSMLHNWRTSALNGLFRDCGAALLGQRARHRYEMIGAWAVRKQRRACLSYNAKLSQLSDLLRDLGADRLFIVDYDDLVAEPAIVLPKIYNFVGLDYDNSYARLIHSRSVGKIRRQRVTEANMISDLCMPVYLEAKNLLSV